MAFVAAALKPLGRNSQTTNTIWVYSTTADTLAQVTTSGYFNATDLSLALNDVIVVQATNGVTLVSVATIGGGGAVTLKPADIDDVPTTEEITISDGSGLDAGDTPPGTGAPLQDFLEYLTDQVNLAIQDGLNVGTGTSFFAGNDTTDLVNKRMRFRRIVGQNDQVDLNFFQDGDTIVGAAETTLLREINDTGAGVGLVANPNAGGIGFVKSLTTGAGGTFTIVGAGGGQEAQLDIADTAFVSTDDSVLIENTGAGKIDIRVAAAPPPDVVGVFATLRGEDNVNITPAGINLNFAEPEQPHNRSTVTSNVFDGTSSFEIQSRSSDPKWSVDIQQQPQNPKKRCEFSWRPRCTGNWVNEQSHWCGMAFFLPTLMGGVNGCSFMQLHNLNSVTAALQVFGGTLRFTTEKSTGSILHMNIPLAPFLNQWNTMVINYRSSSASTGFLRLWINDVQRVNHTGPNKPPGVGPAFFKNGCYFWGSGNFGGGSTAICRFDNIRLGNATSNFGSVDPNTPF